MYCMVKYVVVRTVGLEELGELDVRYAILSMDGSGGFAIDPNCCMCADTALVWSVPMLSAQFTV